MRSALARAALASLMWAGAMVLWAPSAGGHAVFKSSRPERGARLDAPPGEISVAFTEPPVTDSVLVVRDGCRRNVASSIEVLNDEITAQLADAQPGRWTVRWRVVSAIDGHPTSGGMSLRVAGKPVCSAADDPEQPPDEGGGGESSLIVLAIASVAVVGAGIAVRVATTRGADKKGTE